MRVPDNALRSIVYLGFRAAKRPFRAAGTGFLVSLERDSGTHTRYLVTADHVARKLEKMVPTFAARLNDAQGVAHDLIPSKGPKWWRHPTDRTVDVAVYPWHLLPAQFPFTVFPSVKFVTQENLQKTLIGIGDDIYITGLFRKWAGKDKISPVVRRGHIAMMAGERVPTANYGDARFHLIEAMASSGLSGSPVFVEETVSVPLHQETPEDSPYLFGLGDTYLLGLVHGFLPIKVAEEIMGAPSNQLWHSGICLVVPSEDIMAVLNQPTLLEYEENIVKNSKVLSKAIRKRGAK